MKVMCDSQIKQVSGAGFMADMGWADFGELLAFAQKRQINGDLLSLRPSDGSGSDVKEYYLEWCDKNGLDAQKSAMRNGWKL
ncbi:hypothetical protein [Pseudomonas graminis]